MSRFNDNDGDGFPDNGGNLVFVRGPRPIIPTDRFSNIPADILAELKLDPSPINDGVIRQNIESCFTYNSFGQMTSVEEADDDIHGVLYGQGVWDQTSNPNAGYPVQSVADIAVLQLSSSTTYDIFGRPQVSTNPRGHQTTYQYNALDLLEKVIAPAPFLYESEAFYDGNNNLVKSSVQLFNPVDNNGDGLQTSNGEQVFVENIVNRSKYGVLDKIIEIDADAASPTNPGKRLVSRLIYDPNENLTKMIKPKGNSVSAVYDERDQVVKSKDGDDSSIAEITSFEYDPNGNLAKFFDQDGNNIPTTFSFDKKDRMEKSRDERGNETVIVRDETDFPTKVSRMGESAHFRSEGEGPCVLLRTMDKVNDAAHRACNLTVQQKAPFLVSENGVFFEAEETLPRSSTTLKGPTGYCHGCIDPNSNESFCRKDGVDRTTQSVDPLGNTMVCVYDVNSNRISCESIEIGSSQSFVTETFYDQLDRPVATVHLGARASSTDIAPGQFQMGHTSRVMYDSLGRAKEVTDANGPVGAQTASSLDVFGFGTEHSLAFNPPINDPGNRTVMSYDNISRPESTVEEQTSTGVGGGTIIGTREVSQTWDDNSNLASRTDPKGNTTAYVYDRRDRMVEEVFADGSNKVMEYNRNSTVAKMKDQNGTVTIFEYDELERLIGKKYLNLPNGNVEYQTTFCSYRYDGLNRMTFTEDNDSQVDICYDQMSNVREVRQTVGDKSRTSPSQPLTGSVFSTLYDVDGTGARKAIRYPDGTELVYDIDALNRTTAIRRPFNSNPIVSYAYIGGRLKSETKENNTRTHYSYDGAKRLIRIDQRNTNTNQRITGFAYEYDRVGNRRFERKLLNNTNPTEASGLGSAYTYNSFYQLTEAQHNVLSSQLDSVPSNTAGSTGLTSSNNVFDQYSYDVAGNRLSHNRNGTVTNYNKNSGDDERNQYSLVGSLAQSHDLNGNLTSSDISGGTVSRSFDAQNMLVEYNDGTNSTKHRYNALGQRISKTVSGGSGTTTTNFFYDGADVCNEFGTGAAGVDKRYIMGLGVDNPVSLNVNGGAERYYGTNSIGSITALSDASGNLIESYEYKPFGETSVFDGTGTDITASTNGAGGFGNPYQFTARRFETDSGLYFYRSRFYRPETGRFLSHDLLGDWFAGMNRGLGMAYCSNNPINWIDPFGFEDVPAWAKQLAEKDGKPQPQWVSKYKQKCIQGYPRVNESRRREILDAYGTMFQVFGEIIVGLTPVGIVIDGKDLILAVKDGKVVGIFVAFVGFVPAVGDTIKGGYKLSRLRKLHKLNQVADARGAVTGAKELTKGSKVRQAVSASVDGAPTPKPTPTKVGAGKGSGGSGTGGSAGGSGGGGSGGGKGSSVPGGFDWDDKEIAKEILKAGEEVDCMDAAWYLLYDGPNWAKKYNGKMIDFDWPCGNHTVVSIDGGKFYIDPTGVDFFRDKPYFDKLKAGLQASGVWDAFRAGRYNPGQWEKFKKVLGGLK